MSLWYGLSDDDVIRMWDRQGWREQVTRTIIKTAEADYLSDDTRVRALQLMNEVLLGDILVAEARLHCIDYPTWSRNILLQLLQSKSPETRWWNRGRARRLMRQFEASVFILRTVSIFIASKRESGGADVPSKTLAIDTLLS
jgi:hypothetical protein